MTAPQVAQAKRQLVQNFPKTRQGQFFKNVAFICKFLLESILSLEFNLWHQACILGWRAPSGSQRIDKKEID
jgi:hypothetical protein